MQPRAIQAVALAYDGAQDRILAVINPAALNSWSYWLTRRVVLEVLSRLPSALASSSSIAGRAPAEYREDLAAFETEAALATTAPAMTITPINIMSAHASAAELAVTISLEDHGETFRLLIAGERGHQAVGAMSRPDLQRILHMLGHEVVKAAWSAAPAEPAQQVPPARRRRRVN